MTCKHSSRIVVFKEGSMGATHKFVTLCQDCGRFCVSVSGDLQDFDFEFRLTTPEQFAATVKGLTDMTAISEYLIEKGWLPRPTGEAGKTE